MFSSSVVMDEEQLDDETSAQLSQIFGNSRGIKSEFDAEINNLNEGNDNNNYGHNNIQDITGDIDDNDANVSKSHNDVLQNLSALFSASGTGFDYHNSGLGSGSSGNNILNLSDDRGNNMFGLDNALGNNNIMLNHNNNPVRRRAPRGCGTNQRYYLSLKYLF